MPHAPHTHLLLKLLPAVGPGPVMSLVETVPHSHHLIATVIEDGSDSSKKDRNTTTLYDAYPLKKECSIIQFS